MTPLEQVKRIIENTINQFKRELESLRLDVRSCEDVIEGFQQALNDIQKVKPAVIDKDGEISKEETVTLTFSVELSTLSAPQGLDYFELCYPDDPSPGDIPEIRR